MNKLLSLGLAAATLFAAPAALPCGAPFGPGMNVDPNQDIILVHKAGVETYVFQPTFCGAAENFGVILPVPSMLTSEPALAEARAFGGAERISQPKIVERTECRTRGNDFSTDAGAPGTSGGTTVVASGTVGFLDWVQLEAKDEASFTSWLDANGYPYDARAKATFDHYVAKKWFFVAFKVSQGAVPTGTTPCKSLGPIKLSFKTPAPIVPSKMATAAKASGFSWRVFAITEGKEQVGFASADGYSRKQQFGGAIADADVPSLAGLAAKGDRLTKLSVWFSEADSEDVQLKLVPPAEQRETEYHTTYVDCPPGTTEPPAQNNATDPATDGGGAGCSTSPTRAPLLGFGLGLAALALLRRRR